jgi:TolB-like protein/DNA-binding winged helix-turn-helix (wHTH) protein
MTTASRVAAPAGYRVGDIEIDLVRRRVSRNGRDISVGKLSYKMLVALAQAAPRVLTREDLIERVWNARYVNPATVKQRIVLLRKALGDNAEVPRYISVVRGQGYCLIPPVEVIAERPSTAPGNLRRFAAVLLTAVLVVGLMLGGVWRLSSGSRATVGVLPFANLSPDPEDAFFATGLHEEVINQLASLDDLRVISRASVQRYDRNGEGIRNIAADLQVDAVLEGTVRYMDERVRIGMQLTDPDNNAVLWSQTYERDFSDIFEIQRDIAMSVTGALGITLRVGGKNGFQGAGTENIEAYEAYLQAIDSLRRPEGRARGMAFLQQATRLDPSYSAAWAQLGFETATASLSAAPERAAQTLEEAYQYALRATELDPGSARAASILGTLQYERFDWIGAEKSHIRAIALDASRFTLAQHANLLVRAGRMTAAASEFSAAMSLDPSSGPQPPLRVQASIGIGDYAEATRLAASERRAVLRDRVLLNIALNEGDRENIMRAMTAMIETQPITRRLYAPLLNDPDSTETALAAVRIAAADDAVRWPAKLHDVAMVAAWLGDSELALSSIAEDVRLTTARHWALWYPIFAEARKLPEFKELVRELNLLDYWRAYGWADACAPLGEREFTC